MIFPVRLIDQGADWPAIIQAAGSIVAIGAGFLALVIQNEHRKAARRSQTQELAATVGAIACEAIETVAQRLEAALHTKKGRTLFALRGHRTTEMVEAMREFDLSVLPPEVAGQFARVRSGIYAVNARITDIFDSERLKPEIKARRRARLESSGRVLAETLQQYERLREVLDLHLKVAIGSPAVSADVRAFAAVAVVQSVSPQDAFD